jgi:hypothetical protein
MTKESIGCLLPCHSEEPTGLHCLRPGRTCNQNWSKTAIAGVLNQFWLNFRKKSPEPITHCRIKGALQPIYIFGFETSIETGPKQPTVVGPVVIEFSSWTKAMWAHWALWSVVCCVHSLFTSYSVPLPYSAHSLRIYSLLDSLFSSPLITSSISCTTDYRENRCCEYGSECISTSTVSTEYNECREYSEYR